MVKEVDRFGGYYYEFSFDERKFSVELPVDEIPDMEAYCCSFRMDAFFMEARTGKDINTIPQETQFLAIKHADKSYSVYFSIVDEYFRSCMYGKENQLWISAITGDPATTAKHFCGLYRIDGNDFYALAHFSKYMQVGAVRVDSTDTGADSDYKLCNVVVVNPDGTMTAVIVNSNKEDVICKMVMGDQVMEVNAPAKSTITITWEAECK